MGCFRFLLAVFVMFSHLNISMHKFFPGGTAVISFFILSGYVMTALVTKYYNSLDKILPFYLDRAIRLFPQFLFYLCLTLVFIYIAFPQSEAYLSDVSLTKVFLNFLMMPLGFYGFFHLKSCFLIPQAWSLGLEFTFYLMIPFILVLNLRRSAFILSGLMFLMGYFEFIDPELHCYRLITGTLFIFLCGSYLYKSNITEKLLLSGTYIVLFFLLGSLIIFPSSPLKYTYCGQVILGFMVGFPIVVVLSKLHLGKFDAILGQLSYGIFLNHYLLIWVFRNFGMDVLGFPEVCLITFFSITLSYLSYYFIEHPVMVLRYKLREKELLSQQTQPTSVSVVQ